MSTIKINGKPINYTRTAKNEFAFADGRKITVPTSVSALDAYNRIAPPPLPPVPANKLISIGPDSIQELHDVENVTYLLKPGVYTLPCSLKNLKNVIIDGGNQAVFKGIKGSVFELTGQIQGLTLQNFLTKDCSIDGYQIAVQGFKPVYDPNRPETFMTISLVNINSDNGGPLFHADGDIQPDGSHTGVMQSFVMRNCTFTNAPAAGMMCYLGNACNYDISGNVINNINTKNDNHNGIFMLKGNGNFYNNRCTNHQGNLLRAWLYSHAGTQEVNISNNTIVGSRKYSAFEIQAQKDNLINPFTPANAVVYHNTSGNLNTSNDWNGQMLDVYAFGGKLDFYNNLGFNFKRGDGRPVDDMLNSQYEVTRGMMSDNVYKKTQQEAVDSNFRSIIATTGAR